MPSRRGSRPLSTSSRAGKVDYQDGHNARSARAPVAAARAGRPQPPLPFCASDKRGLASGFSESSASTRSQAPRFPASSFLASAQRPRPCQASASRSSASHQRLKTLCGLVHIANLDEQMGEIQREADGNAAPACRGGNSARVLRARRRLAHIDLEPCLERQGFEKLVFLLGAVEGRSCVLQRLAQAARVLGQNFGRPRFGRGPVEVSLGRLFEKAATPLRWRPV